MEILTLFKRVRLAIKNVLIVIFGNITSHNISTIIRDFLQKEPYVLILTLHDTASKNNEKFQKYITLLKSKYKIITPQEFYKYLDGTHQLEKRSILFTFDDGIASNYFSAAKTLEENECLGLFLIPNKFISDDTRSSINEELQRADDYNIIVDPSNLTKYQLRASMTWEQVQDLINRGHSIGCHTNTHQRLIANLTPQQYEYEVINAKSELEKKLGTSISTFCWVGGETNSYSLNGSKAIKKANFKYSLMSGQQPINRKTDNLNLHRFTVETSWSINRMLFATNILNEWRYLMKKSKIEKITRI